MTVHELKCWPIYFHDVVDGTKTFELRKDDRNYAVGDVLELQEYVAPLYDAPGQYTGRSCSVEVVGIMRGRGGDPRLLGPLAGSPQAAVKGNWIVMSIKKLGE